MSRQLFVSECHNCDGCVGVCRSGCNRYAYWYEEQSSGMDCPHYTGYYEDEAREMAQNKPNSDIAACVRDADNEERLVCKIVNY